MKNAPFVRNPYNYDLNKASDESGLECKDPTLAQQHFKDETDINYIADRFGLTGEMPQIQGAMWGQNFVGLFDYQTAQNQIIEANRQFMALPAKVRDRFHNDPARLMDFLLDEDNRDEAIKLGLVNRPPEPPQSPRSDPAAGGDGDLPPPEPKAAGDLPKKPGKPGKDT